MFTSTVATNTDVRGSAASLVSTVPSASQPGTAYTVTIGLDGCYACTCPAGQRGFLGCKRLPYCKHVAAELHRYAAWAHVGSSATALKMYDETVHCRSCGVSRRAVVIEQTRSACAKRWTTICGCGARSTLDLSSPGAAFVN